MISSKVFALALIEIEPCALETMREIGMAERYVRKNGIGRHQKNMKDLFRNLMERGNPKLAIRYAKRIIEENKGKSPTDIAPGTKVYELVEELAKYLPEKIKEKYL